ncbi:MAG: hypothetical protein MUC40_10710 [Akkermansiaceae bacterium]|nr:hypothetical protein [Akkermansiaceae bacterium]
MAVASMTDMNGPWQIPMNGVSDPAYRKWADLFLNLGWPEIAVSRPRLRSPKPSGGPRLVDRTVMLSGFADMGAAEIGRVPQGREAFGSTQYQ